MSLIDIGTGLLGYYKFDTASGVTFDSWTTAEHLVNINAVVSGIGKVDEGGIFVNASDQRLEASGANVFNFDGTEDFTLTCWAEVNSLNPVGSDQAVIGKYDDPGATNDRQYLLFFDASSDQWRAIISEDGASNSADVTPTNNITANVFDFLVMEWDASEKRLTLTRNNGTGGDTATAVAANAVINQSARPFEIGFANTGADPAFDGTIDEVTVHDRLLSTEEKTLMYNGGDGIDLIPFLFAPTVSGSFGGYMKGQPIIGSTSGQFGGYMVSRVFVPAASFGGFLFSKATNDARNVASFGGYTKGVAFQETSGQFGGYMLAQPTTPTTPALFGGVASGARSQSAGFGGWMFGAPGAEDFAELHARTLVKVRSEDVVDQKLDLDGQMILFQRGNSDFTAKLGIESTADSQFHGKLQITRDSIIPMTFANVSKVTVSGVTELTVEASGRPGETDSFFVSAQVDFGEPYDVEFGVEGQALRGGVALPTVSGSISGFEFEQLNPGPPVSGFSKTIRASHVYNHPGRYIITTKFTDNLGIVYMQGFECDLIDDTTIASISGTVPVKGIDYPAIEISGIPREGSVPTSLRVDYTLGASGTGFAVLDDEVGKLNNTTSSSYDFVNWNFGNGFTTTIKRPFTYYDAPGLYIPVLRYQYSHPSGIQTGVDASGIPVYGPRSIWLSESLLVGHNI